MGYSSQGLNEWRYSFGSAEVSQVREFSLNMKTNFSEIEFPDNTLSPTSKKQTNNGWDLTWDYKSLVAELQGVGFVAIRRAVFGDSDDPRFSRCGRRRSMGSGDCRGRVHPP